MITTLFMCLLLFAPAPRPVVLWVSEPVRPGQTVLVFGEGFSGVRSVVIEQGKRRAVVPSAQTRARSVKVVLPRGFASGPFVLRTTGLVLPVNHPKVLWVQGDAGASATPGGAIRAFGTCLAWPGSKPIARLEGAGASFAAPCSAPDGFSLIVRVPSTARPGAYRLRVHSGAGGPRDWSAPVPVSVVRARNAPQRRVSVTDFGCTGRDGLDDTAAVQKAIRAVSSRGGGVVEFPRGRFVLTAGIALPPGVTLQGAGMGQTALCWPDSDRPPEALIRGTHDFGVADLTLYAMNHCHGIVGDQGPAAGGNVRICRVRLRMNPYRGHLTEDEVARRFAAQQKFSTGGADCLRLGGPNVQVLDCDMAGGGRSIYLSGARNSVVARNRFANGRWGWYCLSGSDGLVFEDNVVTAGDLMSTGGGINCLDGSMVSRNVYFARNRLGECPGWDREAMTSDAGGGAYYGRIESASALELTLAEDPKWEGRDWRGAAVFVLDGRGQGQYRQIARTDGRRVTVDQPWTIPPDRSSIVTITMLQANYLFIGNTMTEAGVAIQLYGTAVGHIASGNVSRRTDGFHNFGMNYYGVQPSWFVQWLDNRIEDGNVYGGGHDQSVAVGEAHLGVFALPPGVEPRAPVTLGCVVRGNRLESNAHLGLGGTPDSPAADYPYVQEAVVEGNQVRAASCGLVRSARGVEGALIRDNDFRGCAAEVVEEQPALAARRARLRELLRHAGVGQAPLLRLPFTADLLDATNNGFDAVAQGGGARIVADDRRGACLELDGASRCVVRGSELLNLETFTIALWVKPRDAVGRFGLVSKRAGSAPAPYILSLQGDRLGFEATDAAGGWTFNFMSEPVLKAGVWQHVAAVKEAGKGVTLYVDGRPVAHLDNDRATFANDSPIYIGWEAWGGFASDASKPAWFRGRLSDLTIWPRALSAAEVAALR